MFILGTALVANRPDTLRPLRLSIFFCQRTGMRMHLKIFNLRDKLGYDLVEGVKTQSKTDAILARNIFVLVSFV